MPDVVLESKTLGYDTVTRKAAFGNGTGTFTSLPSAFGIEPAPDDGYIYGRKMGEWVRIVTPSEPAAATYPDTSLAPDFSIWYDRVTNVTKIGLSGVSWNESPRIGMPEAPMDGGLYLAVGQEWVKIDETNSDITVLWHNPEIAEGQVIDIVSGQEMDPYSVLGTYIRNEVQDNMPSTSVGAITSVAWSATDMPEGLTIAAATGVISGTPTTPGTYTTTLTVVTNWGTDTETITINVYDSADFLPIITSGQELNLVAGVAMEPYEVSGINVRMPLSLSEILANNDWHNLHKYVKDNGVADFVIGTEVLTHYTEPLGTNAETVYDLPAILVDKGTAVIKGGTEVPALYFMSKYALPCTGVHAANGAGLMLDNAEPSNSEGNRKSHGNNRYMHSAIRQWLNGTGTDWWASQHTADAEPDPDYVRRPGLLSCLDASLVAELRAIKVQVRTATVDGDVTDAMYDKIFLPSLEELNRTYSDATAIAAAGIEGHAWQYWKDALSSTSLVGEAENANAIIYGLEDHTKAEYVWTRSASHGHSSDVWSVHTDGSLYKNYASYTSHRVAPAWTILGI